MTRTTFKALWVGGGGVLATWVAVAPNGVPATSPANAARPAASASGPTAEELNTQAARLRNRTAALTFRPATRNPFKFSSPKPNPRSSAERAVQSPAIESQIPTVPLGPTPRLSGIAQKAGKRTAILSVGEQIYLAGEGDSIAGRFSVVTIDPEAVVLRDTAGTEQRLVLPQ